MIQLQEHERLIQNGLTVEYDNRYNNLELIRWDKPMDHSQWGYYALFKIGAEWVDENEPLIVTAKRGMENIDFLGMFMTCFSSNLALDSFSEIYKIDIEKPPINAPALCGIVSPLIVVHFLSIVNRIKSLKRGYVHHCENLKKVKGHIKFLKNERVNIATKRFDRIFCEYDDYSTDIPENKLLKKALLFSEALINGMSKQHRLYPKIKFMISKTLTKFDGVTDDVDIKSVGQIRSHKLFSEYAEAIRLAKIILKRFDYSINKASSSEDKVIPFTLDMSLLYEHYVYGLLSEAYQDKITYQFKGKTGYPDFLFKSRKYKAILDTKYIPKYQKQSLDNDVVRQLSGYSRDIPILKHLGYDDVNESSPLPSVPCVIVYPEEGTEMNNPFLNNDLSELCSKPIAKLSRFYKLSIPVPTISR
jgi:5-methylcytosine-specific restriction enzyme subunit McrC